MGLWKDRFRDIYHRLPLPLKDVAASAYGWQMRRSRYRRVYRQSLDFLRESQFWSNEKLIEYQQGQLHEFLQRVIPETPYYRATGSYRDLVGQDAPLSEFPIITKADLRRDTTAFINDRVATMHPKQMHTSGTTGTALVFPVSDDHFQREQAFRALAYEWGGVSLDGRDRVAFCAGHPVASPGRQKPPFWVRDRISNWLYMSSYHLTRDNLRHYVAELERFAPVMLGGYPSSLYLLALGYKKYGTGKLKIRSISSSSETLTEMQRAVISDAFGAAVFDYYGSAEMCCQIAECEQGELHLKFEHSHVEILDENDRPCLPGETGRLVCTGFGNYAFPLIRYDLGDLVTIAEDQTSKCGRGGLLIEKILGRAEDYVTTPEGLIVGRLDHIFKDSVNVIEAQIFQERADEVVFRIVKDVNYSDADEQAILDEARLRLGSGVNVSFEYLKEIPRSANGKFRFILSKIDQDKLTEL